MLSNSWTFCLIHHFTAKISVLGITCIQIRWHEKKNLRYNVHINLMETILHKLKYPM